MIRPPGEGPHADALSLTIRAAAPQDGTFMGDMLVEAVNWSREWKKKSRARA